MPASDLLVPFLAATVIFALMPGPAILYTAAQTMARGRSGGVRAALGIHFGGYVHVAAAATGLSAVLRYVPELYLAVKIAGAIYLIWLGVSMFREPRGEVPVVDPHRRESPFLQSVLVEVLNPKAALFFIAFLPQFVDPAASWPLWLQVLSLGTFVNLAFSSVDLLTVVLTSTMVGLVRRSGAGQRLARSVGGSLLVGLGVHLAASRTT